MLVSHKPLVIGPPLKEPTIFGLTREWKPRTSEKHIIVEIQPPKGHINYQQLSPITISALQAIEENPPTGEEPVSWLLLTTLLITDFTSVKQYLRWYYYRWLIERYHFVLKSGCRLEQLQLETADRIERAIATYTIVAWRLLWNKHHADRQSKRSNQIQIILSARWKVLRSQRRWQLKRDMCLTSTEIFWLTTVLSLPKNWGIIVFFWRTILWPFWVTRIVFLLLLLPVLPEKSDGRNFPILFLLGEIIRSHLGLSMRSTMAIHLVWRSKIFRRTRSRSIPEPSTTLAVLAISGLGIASFRRKLG